MCKYWPVLLGVKPKLASYIAFSISDKHDLSNALILYDEDDKVAVGDKVVTSNISDKYLPGILIGYISTIEEDSNNLTKSGKITPVVQFEYMNEVLVIMKLKNTGE